MRYHLVWLRQDLRLRDNPALLQAATQGDCVIPVYILDDVQPWAAGGAARWWLHHSLCSLSETFAKRQISLILKRGPAQSVLQQLVLQYQIEAVHWNRCYEPDSIARDKQIKQQLTELGVKVHSYNGYLWHEPWEIQTQAAHYFQVFTPYWKMCRTRLTELRHPYPTPHLQPFHSDDSDKLETWQLAPQQANWAKGLRATWQVGENAAHQELKSFITDRLCDYAVRRDIPAAHHTSHLSPHLHWGEISVHQIYHALAQVLAGNAALTPAYEKFLAELGWREFSYHLLYHFPQLPTTPFRNAFAHFVWQPDRNLLRAWQQGKTGYPLVDAGMRELWATGYMHNRVRMVAASFLTKHLLQPWQDGARWFWDTLVDADLANNSASWQWVAGCGADAAPYFRIFNPVLQSEKFDPEGVYLKRWLPELAHLDSKTIHQPWQATESRVHAYPAPIVVHAQARARALARYAAMPQRQS